MLTEYKEHKSTSLQEYKQHRQFIYKSLFINMLVLMSHPMQHIYNMFHLKLWMKHMQPRKHL